VGSEIKTTRKGVTEGDRVCRVENGQECSVGIEQMSVGKSLGNLVTFTVFNSATGGSEPDGVAGGTKVSHHGNKGKLKFFTLSHSGTLTTVLGEGGGLRKVGRKSLNRWKAWLQTC